MKEKNLRKSICIICSTLIVLCLIFLGVNRMLSNSGDKNLNVDKEIKSKEHKEPVKDQVNSKSNTYTLNVDGIKEGIKISDMLYGLFFEDINFAADGGLYAELIINRSFEFTTELASNGALHGYTSFGSSKIKVLDKTPLNNNNPHYLNIKSTSTNKSGFKNKGFLEGIPLTKGESYRFSVYLKSSDYKGNIGVSLNDEKDVILAEGKISNINETWTKYTVTLQPTKTIKKAKFTLYMQGKGSVDVDMVSLFPVHTYKNRENGLRADLVDKIKALNPSFIRFPGGCIIEGNSIKNAYRWKDTIGDVAKRKQNTDLWKGTKQYPYYQSYGLGFYEYFQLCEDIGAKPIPVINAGMSCQAQTREFGYSEKATGDELQEYIQDALDLIEFCNGDTTTKWGKIRAKMGHKKPFHLEYLAIGNEQFGEDYFSRYEKFKDAIRKVYPKIQLISTSGPASDGVNYDAAWSRFKRHSNDTIPYVDIVDEHYYNAPEWFLSNTQRYDSYDRNTAKVFLGEYAAKSNTIYAAVAEAAYMTSLERNSDVVKMASYAPLFGNLVSHQWEPDMIWFNNDKVFGTANYYVQKMFSTNVGTKLLESNLSQEGDTKERLSGKVGVGTWKTGAFYDDIKVVNNDTGEIMYQNNFDKEDKKWKDSLQGVWKISEEGSNKVYGQKNTDYPTNNAIMGSASYVGEDDWTNYTYTLKAKKVAGSEGFLIPFAVEDNENFIHWNIGGWGNTQSAVERAMGGTKSTITESIGTKIITNKWYDIKVVVTNNQVECYLNNKKIHSFTIEAMKTMFQTVSKDEKTGDVIIKIVNASEKSKVNINLKHIELTNKPSSLQALSNDNKNAKNSLQNQEYIVPKKKEMVVKDKFTLEVPAFSVSILRIPTK